jgi:hypothetical protein
MEAAWRQKLEGHRATALDGDRRFDEPSVTAASMRVLPSAAVTASRGGVFPGRGIRRLGVSVAAATLAGLMVGSSVFAASRAGGPLYGPRLELEQLTLPSGGQARLEAELALAQGRLAEIVDAVSRDDPAAVAASVQAYLTMLDELGDSHGDPADRALEAIESHRGVLLEVLARVPAVAKSGIETALAQSNKVIERLDAAAGPLGGGGGRGTNNGSGSGRGSGAGGAGGGHGTTGSGSGSGSGGAGANSGNGSGANSGSGSNNGNGPSSNSGNGPGSNSGTGPGSNSGNNPAPTPKPTQKPKPTKAPTPAPVAPTPATPTDGDPSSIDGASSAEGSAGKGDRP